MNPILQRSADVTERWKSGVGPPHSRTLARVLVGVWGRGNYGLYGRDGVARLVRFWEERGSADYKSAIRQSATLRYGRGLGIKGHREEDGRRGRERNGGCEHATTAARVFRSAEKFRELQALSGPNSPKAARKNLLL